MGYRGAERKTMITKEEIHKARVKKRRDLYEWQIGDKKFDAQLGTYRYERQYSLGGPGIERWGKSFPTLNDIERFLYKLVNEPPTYNCAHCKFRHSFPVLESVELFNQKTLSMDAPALPVHVKIAIRCSICGELNHMIASSEDGTFVLLLENKKEK
jgi:hypothetical protein